MPIGPIDPKTNPFYMTLKPCTAVDPDDEAACLAMFDTLDELASPEMARAISSVFDETGRATLAAMLRGLVTLPSWDPLPLSAALKARLATLRIKAADLIQERQ